MIEQVDLQDVGNEWQDLDWPADQLVRGRLPPVYIGGSPCRALRFQVRATTLFPQVWIDYQTASGEVISVAYMHNWPRGTVQIRIRRTQYEPAP